jgi:hypothetical protein
MLTLLTSPDAAPLLIAAGFFGFCALVVWILGLFYPDPGAPPEGPMDLP